MRLDDLDARILAALAADARRSLRDVARLLETTPTTVSARVERLKEAGLLTGATLRFSPALLPGRPRLVRGRIDRAHADALLARGAELAGVVDLAIEGDGRFVALLHVRDLDDEEALLEVFFDLGAEEVVVTGARRVEGPPLVHLFPGAVTVPEPCAVCKKDVGEEPVLEIVDGRRVPFCCPSCRRLYMERYEALRSAALDDRRSTSS